MKFYDCGIAITNYCSSQCKFCCIIGKTSNKKQEKYIPVAKGKEFIKIASRLGCEKIVFTGGGEPTTRFNDLIKLMKFAKYMNMQIFLVTNGSYARTEKEAENKTSTMITAGLNTIIFSFDYDHLCHIPFKEYTNAIKTTLKNDELKVQITCVDKKSTKEKNTEYLKKLTKELNGRFRAPFLQKKIKLLLSYEISYIHLRDKTITVLRLPIEYFGCAKSLKHEFDFKKKQRIVFDPTPCSEQRVLKRLNIFNNFDKRISIGCCYPFDSFQYKKNSFEKNINKKLHIFKKISSNIGFLKLYLSIKNLELKSGKKFLEEKYPHKCNLCEDMLKVIGKEKLSEPSKIQISLFIITNMNSFLRTCLRDLLFRLFHRIFDH